MVETDGENSDDSSRDRASSLNNSHKHDVPTCYMCFDEEDSPSNPMITPCKCLGDTRYVHVIACVSGTLLRQTIKFVF